MFAWFQIIAALNLLIFWYVTLEKLIPFLLILFIEILSLMLWIIHNFWIIVFNF